MSDYSKHGVSLPPEQQAIRDKCFHPSGIFVEFTKVAIERSIPDVFEEAAVKFSGRLAVADKEQTITFNTLNETANRIARIIVERFGAENKPIAIMLEHSAMAVVGALALLKAGKMLVAIDPSFPSERIKYVLQDSQCSGILTNDKHILLAKALEVTEKQIVNIDQPDNNVPTDNIGLVLQSDTLAQVAYTSGSTGQPKGILRSHRNLLHEAMVRVNALRIHRDDRYVLLHTPTANAFLFEMLAVLLSGATLLPFDVKDQGFSRLAEWLLRERATIFRSLSSTFRSFVNTLSDKEIFPHLRLISVGGEPIFRRDVEMYKKHFPVTCTFVVQLGGGETGEVSRHFINKTSQIEENVVPVGWPVPDKQVLLIDESGKKVCCGEVGEIAVRSSYLSLGYWRNSQFTSQKFLTDANGGDERTYMTGDLGRMRSDGCLIHVGRKDSLTKVRGYTISVAEVEMALLEHPQVKEASGAVWDSESESGEKYLAAYVVPRNESAPTVTALLTFLRTILPDYMLPSAIVFLKSLPQTNGKVDRRSLPRPDRVRPNLDNVYVSSRSEIQRRLVAIWEEVLSIRPVGIHDNFFDLGGHSLAASRIISRILKTFDLDLPIKALFDSPTVADMALVITQNQAKRASDAELAQMLRQVEAMTEEEAQEQLARENARSSSGDRHE